MRTVLHPYDLRLSDITEFFRTFYSSKSQGSEARRTLQGEDIRTKEPLTLTTPLYGESNVLGDNRLEETGESGETYDVEMSEEEQESDFERGIKE